MVEVYQKIHEVEVCQFVEKASEKVVEIERYGEYLARCADHPIKKLKRKSLQGVFSLIFNNFTAIFQREQQNFSSVVSKIRQT